MRSVLRLHALGFLLAVPAAAVTIDQFESGHVHPVEISPDGTRLFVVHTSGNELAVFDLTNPTGPVRIGKVAVGYEPVTVRARSNNEVWVVCHISDAVNVVDVSQMTVVRTIRTGDEPTDVAFVEAQNRAFVCLSQLDTIAAYNLADLTLPPTDIPLLHSDPRSLALSPDGSTLYVAALDSQNETSVVRWEDVLAGGGAPPPNPPMDPTLPPVPDEALIVRYNGTSWVDETGKNWGLPYTLYDHDVIEIDTSTLAVSGFHRGVGTTLFNIAVHPVTGVLYVTNQEAINEVRFEQNLHGRFTQARVTLVDPAADTVTPVHLNPHIDYDDPAGNPTERALSLSIPLDMDISSDGSTIYLAAMGSRKVGVLNTSGAVTRRIVVGEGPSGLALDETRNALYVVNRFASTLSVVDLTDDSSYELPLGHDPSHPDIVNGRKFLYDGELSSAHGDNSCATCHVFGKMDGIAWDLGNPLGVVLPPKPTSPTPNAPPGIGYHPMKGPMVTQTLQGLRQGVEALHWRGERTTLADFNPTFVDLQGRSSQLTDSEMQQLEGFVHSMLFPPQPNRMLDGSHLPSINGADPANGDNLFSNAMLAGTADCTACHTPPHGNRDTLISLQLVQGNQDMVTVHLRNQYEKTRFTNTPGQTVRGYGFLHDGAFANHFDFFLELSDLQGFDFFPGFTTDAQRRDVEAFMMAFPTGIHPAAAVMVTMDGTNTATVQPILQKLLNATGGATGLVAKGRDAQGQLRGWMRVAANGWRVDRFAERTYTTGQLQALAGPGREMSFLAALPQDVIRLGVDRDEDGFWDRDELDAGTDPDNAAQNPGSVSAPLALALSGGQVWLAGANPTNVPARLGFQVPQRGPAALEVYNVAGRRVQSLLNSPNQLPGTYEAVWDLRDAAGQRVAPGVYFVRLSSGVSSAEQRVVIMR